MNEFYIYELQYPDGTTFYFGKGKGDRCNNHLRESNNQNRLKQNIINKIRRNGDEPLLTIKESNLIESKAFEIEISLIAHYGRRDIGTGILSNLTDGGEGVSGYKVSKEHRYKNSQARMGNTNASGKRSEESIQNIKNGCKKRFPPKEEHKRNTSIAMLNSPLVGKNVGKYSINGELIKTYNSASAAARENNITQTCISDVCRGVRELYAGFIWKYL